MACCIIAAYVWIWMRSVVWRWAAFWGLARPPEHIVYDTVYVRVTRWFRRAVLHRGEADSASRPGDRPVFRTP